MTLTLMPVSLVNSSNSGWISLCLAIGVDVHLAGCASAGDAAAAMATASMLNEVGPRRIGNLLRISRFNAPHYPDRQPKASMFSIA